MPPAAGSTCAGSGSLYSVAIGLLAGAWVQDRPLVAIVVGVTGGILSGLVLDWGLNRRQNVKDHSDAGIRGTATETTAQIVGRDCPGIVTTWPAGGP